MTQSKKSSETTPGQMVRVLLVEDDPDQRTMLEEVLSIRGISVTAAGDGTEAEKIASGQAFDVVVSDIRLPGMDGLELARRMAEQARPPKIILITAFPSPRTLELGYMAGAVQVLSKPFGLDRFTQMVEEIGRQGRHQS